MVWLAALLMLFAVAKAHEHELEVMVHYPDNGLAFQCQNTTLTLGITYYLECPQRWFQVLMNCCGKGSSLESYRTDISASKLRNVGKDLWSTTLRYSTSQVCLFPM